MSNNTSTSGGIGFPGYAGRYVDAEDIHQLVHEMKKLK